MATQPAPTRRDVELQLIKRAWTDPAFAQQLRENPRQAVKAALGVELPEGITVQVVQETPTTLYLVVPPTGHAAGGRAHRRRLGCGGRRLGYR